MITLNQLSTIAVYDLETTGVETGRDRIVTAFVGLMGRDGIITERKEWLVNPGVDIPAGAAAIHGISTEHAATHGADPRTSVAEIVGTLRGHLDNGIPISAYNGVFDFSMLYTEALRYNIDPLGDPEPVIDPLILDKHLDKYRRGSRKLVDTARLYGVELIGAHDAVADATATGRLAWAILAKLPQEINLRDLHATMRKRFGEQTTSFQEYQRRRVDPNFTASTDWPVRKLTPSELVEAIAS